MPSLRPDEDDAGTTFCACRDEGRYRCGRKDKGAILEMYVNKPLKEYLDDLAARKPAPGGGSAAALEAATGCALLSMVANFTISNKRYEGFKGKAEKALSKSEGLRTRLMTLVDDDVRVYSELTEALKKYKKDSPEFGDLYKKACNVPYDICRVTGEALTLCRELVEYGNKNLITDTAIAALMLESAFFGAKFNVYINLKDIKDSAYVENVHKVIHELEERIPRLKEEVLHKSEEVILK